MLNLLAFILGKKNDDSGKAIDLLSWLLGKGTSGGGGGGTEAKVGTAIVGQSVIGG